VTPFFSVSFPETEFNKYHRERYTTTKAIGGDKKRAGDSLVNDKKGEGARIVHFILTIR
jgi:hypothetical protein